MVSQRVEIHYTMYVASTTLLQCMIMVHVPCVQGTGVKCYLEEDPNAPGNIAIASYLDGTNKYYLQPQVGDNKIIGKTGDPQYVFGFVNPQPLPSLS